LEKLYVQENDLLLDAYRLGVKIYNSGFRPNFIVGLWRGGSSVGISVQECLQHLGVETDHIAIRTSYSGMQAYAQMLQNAEAIHVHGTQYLLENLNADDRLLIVDDVYSSGSNVKAVIDRLSQRTKRNMPRELRIAVPWYKPANNHSGRVPDFYLHETDRWLVLPYELKGLTPDEIRTHKSFLIPILHGLPGFPDEAITTPGMAGTRHGQSPGKPPAAPTKPGWLAALLATRPKTLTASITPVAVAGALLTAQGVRVSPSLLIPAGLSALLIQIGTNLANDAFDYRKGADTAARLGPTRATQAGWLSADQVLGLSHLAFALAVLAGLPLVLHGGWPIAVVGSAAVACGYGYTAGPCPIAYLGLGDLFVLLFFGPVAVVGVSYLHTAIIDPQAALTGLQIGALAAVLLAVNNLRDVDEDRRSGKRTLAVRAGAPTVRALIVALLTFAFAVQLVWWHNYQSAAMLLPLLALPLAFTLLQALYRHPPSDFYNRLLARAAALHLVFGATFVAALLAQ
jgi:1,4-dihydroxy-2-naphthoate octaprenyltransferase